MSTRSLLRPVAALAIVCAASAQQFEWYTYPYETLGLSEPCLAAVNTTMISCPDTLAHATTPDSAVNLFDEESLSVICTDSCASELESLRDSIAAACTLEQDVMVYDHVAYPATFMLDKLKFTHDVGCYQDSTTGSYCHLLLAEWRNETNITAAEERSRDCSDCILGGWKFQLESPIAYGERFAEEFSSATSSCSASDYAYTSPTAYALNSTSARGAATATATATGTSAAPTSTTTCVRTYTVQANDTCNSIAASQGVSTLNLIHANKINIFCSNLVEGSVLCIPELCDSKTLDLGDSCSGLMADYGISMAQLLAWNPIISPSCTRLRRYVDWQICVGPPGGAQEAISGTATSAAPAPTNAKTDSNQKCGKWATIGDGDTCAALSVAFGISLDDFYFLNPEVATDCSNLWLGYAYCVQAVGTITTYDGYTVTTPSTSFTRPATTTISYTIGPSTTLSAAPGSATGCVKYRDHYNSSTLDIAGRSYEIADFDLNSCTAVASIYDVTVGQLVTWNPSLEEDNCELKAGYSYCIIQSWDDQGLGTAPSGSSICVTPDSSQIVSGTASDCSCYVFVVTSQREDEDCASLYDYKRLTEAQFLAMNPWAETAEGCDLYVGLADEDFRAVCLATSASATSTASASVTATTTSATAAASATVTPMPNTTDSCTKYHVVESGDGCWAIANEYGISLDDFYSWNPDVGTDCSSLWLGYGVCVSVS